MDVMQQAKQDAKEYGYEISDNGTVMRESTPTRNLRVVVVKRGKRLIVQAESTGALLWSGARIGDFLEAFWFAKKKVTEAIKAGA